MSDYSVEPIEGQSYAGRQWGWMVLKDGEPFLECSTGGTGPCWNVDTELSDVDSVAMHVCELDDLIAALQVLRESDAYRANVARWA